MKENTAGPTVERQINIQLFKWPYSDESKVKNIINIKMMSAIGKMARTE